MQVPLGQLFRRCSVKRARSVQRHPVKVFRLGTAHAFSLPSTRSATSASSTNSGPARRIRKAFIRFLRPIGAGTAIVATTGAIYYLNKNGYNQPLPRLRSNGKVDDAILSSSVPALVAGPQGNKPSEEDLNSAKRASYDAQGLASHGMRLRQEGESVPQPEENSSPPWPLSMDRLSAIGASITSVEWSSVPNTIKDMIIPEWFRTLPYYVTKLQEEFSTKPDSLAEEIRQDARDTLLNPEIAWDASVRVSNDLCDEEKIFLQRRKKHARIALARYLGLPEYEINIEDVPTIAMCGSGGGLRALVAGTGSYLSAHEAGLFDCVTYTAGVSGSCWLLALYYSSLGCCRHSRLVDHLKARLGVHIAFPPPALALVTAAPTNKFLLSGIIERLQAEPEASIGLVDIYGLLLASRFLVPKGELGVNNADLNLSKQRMYIDGGTQPLPIYTAVRHEIPLAEAAKEKEEKGSVENVKEKAKEEAWFQWFEFTPYELWCEELEAGIPTWAMGRKFANGRSQPHDDGLSLPELKMPLLLGMWGSAFCATLSHYYKEIKPVVKSLIGFSGIDRLIEDRNDNLIKVHPIDPASIPNYVLGLEDRLPKTCPESVFQSSHLQLMDAGMSNNLPIYPLLRPGRDVDILITFDASADVQSDNWLSVADGYARQRGIKGWPVGVGWPKSPDSTDKPRKDLEVDQVATAQEAGSDITAAQHEQRKHEKPTNLLPRVNAEAEDLSYCTIWVGTTEERTSTEEPPPSKKVTADSELMVPNAGITVIYFPFLANDRVEGVDPNTSEFMSTWNFVYTPEQVDKVVALARANFEEGKDQTKAAVRAVYERKKRLREEREWEEKMARRRRKVRLGLVGKLGEGDHFS